LHIYKKTREGTKYVKSLLKTGTTGLNFCNREQ
jgi:hypothetical protein